MCPECRDTGEIVLFTSREPCRACGGNKPSGAAAADGKAAESTTLWDAATTAYWKNAALWSSGSGTVTVGGWEIVKAED